MKNILRTIFLSISIITILSGRIDAQLAAGSIAPNWTLTDMNGQSHTLYNYLDSGYSVIMDVSATWCSPCWGYHQSGALETLYTQHGPSGTNDVRVFWVEGDGATSDGCMTNVGCVDPNHSNTSQGNWLAGTTFPMFNPPTSQANTFNTNYNIGYFPTVYRICPNRILDEITQPTASEAYAICQTCPPPASQANDPAIIQYKGTLVSCSNVDLKVLIQNNGTAPLTACTFTATIGGTQVAQLNWTGNLAKYATQLVTVGSISITTTSNIKISITSSDDNSLNNSITTPVIFKQAMQLPISENFESGSFPAAWDQENKDADGVEWVIDPTTGGFGNSSASAFLNLYSSSAGNIDNLNTTVYDFTTATTPIKLTFDVAYAQYTTENDKLIVRASTNCGSTWTNKYTKAGAALKTAPATQNPFVPTATQWRTDTVDLSSFAGQAAVLVQFNVTSAYGNNLFIDNVNIITPTPGPLSVYLSGVADATDGNCNGTATAVPSGGTPPYSFSWNTTPAQNAATASGLCAGSYTVTITDGIGGTTTATATIAATVGIAQNASPEERISVYPNPSNGIIYFSSIANQNVKVIVYNSLGETILESVKNIGSGISSMVDLSKQPVGIYSVKMISEKNTTVKKVTLSK